MAARWRPSSSERMALWKSKKMRIGELCGEFFKQVLEGEESSGVSGPAITATPPRPPGNGAAIYIEIRESKLGM